MTCLRGCQLNQCVLLLELGKGGWRGWRGGVEGSICLSWGNRWENVKNMALEGLVSVWVPVSYGTKGRRSSNDTGMRADKY